MITIKAITGRCHFGPRGASGGSDNGSSSTNNPTWKAIGYEDRTSETVDKVLNGSGNGKKKQQLREPKLKPANKATATGLSAAGGGADVREVRCDVVIVGSGAGGGTTAGVLSTAGLSVVVLEKGGYHTEKEFAAWGEMQADKGLYEKAGW